MTGGLLSQYGPMVVPFVAAALALGNLLLVAFVLPESLSAERRAQVKAEPAKGFSIRELGSTLALPRVGPLMTVRIAIGFTFAVFEGGFSLWAANALGLTPMQIGFFLGYVGIISVIIQLVLIKPLTQALRRPAPHHAARRCSPGSRSSRGASRRRCPCS